MDETVCSGRETCAELCPEVFRIEEMKEKAGVILPESGPVGYLEEAREACPVSCIHWEE